MSLGKLVLGVFLGISAALLFWGAVAGIATAIVVHHADDTSIPAGTSLSSDCQLAIDSQDQATITAQCSGQNPAQVEAYESSWK